MKEKFFLYYYEDISKKYNEYFQKGFDLLEKQNFDDSLIAFNKSIEFDPTIAKSYYYKAIILALRGKDPEALNNLNTAMELDPNLANVAEFYYLQSNVLDSLKRHPEALNCLDQSIKLNPDLIEFAGFYFNKSQILHSLGLVEARNGNILPSVDLYLKALETKKLLTLAIRL